MKEKSSEVRTIKVSKVSRIGLCLFAKFSYAFLSLLCLLAHGVHVLWLIKTEVIEVDYWDESCPRPEYDHSTKEQWKFYSPSEQKIPDGGSKHEEIFIQGSIH